jgi:hypothetical protein
MAATFITLGVSPSGFVPFMAFRPTPSYSVPAVSMIAGVVHRAMASSADKLTSPDLRAARVIYRAPALRGRLSRISGLRFRAATLIAVSAAIATQTAITVGPCGVSRRRATATGGNITPGTRAIRAAGQSGRPGNPGGRAAGRRGPRPRHARDRRRAVGNMTGLRVWAASGPSAMPARRHMPLSATYSGIIRYCGVDKRPCDRFVDSVDTRDRIELAKDVTQMPLNSGFGER